MQDQWVLVSRQFMLKYSSIILQPQVLPTTEWQRRYISVQFLQLSVLIMPKGWLRETDQHDLTLNEKPG